MKTYTFNTELFRELDELTGLTFTKIAKKAGMSQQAVSRYVCGNYVIPTQTLISISNALHFPIHLFITEDGVSIIPSQEQATIPASKWKPVYFDYKAGDRIFTQMGIGWKTVAEAMDITPQNAHNRFNGKVKFPFDDFLMACSNLNIAPSMFLIDHNEAKAESKSKKEATNNEIIALLRHDIAELQFKYTQLEKRLAEVEGLHRRNINVYQDAYANAAEPESKLYRSTKNKKKKK